MISIVEKTFFQNDLFFSLSLGKRILEYGFEKNDYLTWNENLRSIYLRWGFEVIITIFYNLLDYLGIYLFAVILAISIGLTYFYVLKKITNKNILSFICTIVFMKYISSSLVARAQIISFLLFLIEFYCIEELLKTNKKRYFIMLLIIPVLIVNFHASTFPLYFIFYIPYIAEFILSKMKFKESEDSKIKIENKNIIKILYLIGLAGILGLCSPSGLDAYTYVFKVMNAISVNFISEMATTKLMAHPVIVIMLCLLIGIVAFTKVKVRVTDCFYILGITFMALNTNRYTVFFYLIATLCIFRIFSDCLDYYNINLDFINKKIKIILLIILFLIILLTSINRFLEKISKEYIDHSTYPVNLVKFILEEIDISDMRIFNHYNFGSYLEFKGIKAFIDSRAEMFEEEFNNVTILTDWYMASSGSKNYRDILEKYEITHILLYNDEIINTYIVYDSEWNKIYEDDAFSLYEKIEDYK